MDRWRLFRRAQLDGQHLVRAGRETTEVSFRRTLVNDQYQGWTVRAQGAQGQEHVLDNGIAGQPGIPAKMLKCKPHAASMHLLIKPANPCWRPRRACLQY